MATTTYGNTFTDLQAGINAAQALDYQRANAQDAANTARAVARMQQRGQQAEAEARAKQRESQDSFALAQLLSQQREAEANRTGMMDRERFRGETDKEIERMRLERAATAFDPKAFSTIAEIEALNNEQVQTQQKAQQLSAARKATLAMKKAAQGDKWGPWNSKEYSDAKAAGTLIPESEADTRLKSIDAAAATLGLVPAVDGGFVIPALTPIRIPDMLNRRVTPPGTAPVPAPAAVAPVIAPISPVTIPVAPPAAGAPVPAEAVDFQSVINSLFGQNPGAGGFNPSFSVPAPAPAGRQRFKVDSNFNLIPVQ